MGFRENLKSEMEYQKMTTRRLSELSGVNKRTIDHYLMSSPQEPGVSNAVKIARALNVSAEYLATGSDSGLLRPVAADVRELLDSYTRLPSEVQANFRGLMRLLAAERETN